MNSTDISLTQMMYLTCTLPRWLKSYIILTSSSPISSLTAISVSSLPPKQMQKCHCESQLIIVINGPDLLQWYCMVHLAPKTTMMKEAYKYTPWSDFFIAINDFPHLLLEICSDGSEKGLQLDALTSLLPHLPQKHVD